MNYIISRNFQGQTQYLTAANTSVFSSDIGSAFVFEDLIEAENEARVLYLWDIATQVIEFQ